MLSPCWTITGCLLEFINCPQCYHTPKQRFFMKLKFFPSLWWLLLGSLVFPHCAHTLVFKVGVVGPWNCDPIFSKALPGMAAKLAVDRINKHSSLHNRYKLEHVVLQDDCQTSKALSNFVEFEEHASIFLGPVNPGYCEAASLLGKNWDKGIFSWACVNFQLDNANSYPTFVRTLQSPVRVLFSVMKHFLWAHIGIVSSNENIWVDTANKVSNALRYNGLPIGIVTSMGFTDEDMMKTLTKIKNVPDLRIIIMCMHSVLIGGEEQAVFLQKAHDMGLTDGRFAFVPYDTLLYSLPHKNTSYSVLRNNSKLQEAYDAVLTITMASEEMSFHEAFLKAQENGEIETFQQTKQVSPLFGTIYNGIYFIAKAMENVQRAGAHVSGMTLANSTRNLKFAGFNQQVGTNGQGEGVVNYVILDTDGRSHHLVPTYTINMAMEIVQGSSNTIHFPGGSPPGADSSCWFDPDVTCTGGIELTTVILAFGLICALVLCGLSLTYIIRRRIQMIQMVKGPNKIIMTLEDLTFINPQLSKKKINLDELSDGRSVSERKSLISGAHSISDKSLSTVNHENSNVALYEGDWVWLKKFASGSLCEVQKSTTNILRKMRDLRNENVNPFLGFLCDSGVLAIASEHCSRGSLHDLLRNDDVKLDWMFKSSLLMDLIKGMKYLHHREFPHGRLKSQNCLVDGRFVLKIADYGYLELLETQKVPQGKQPAEELFWTAPEFLRDPELSKKATLKGDSYSFAIILQEVVVRGSPYCMLGLSPEEIIRKVKKPPPMCRPTVSPDQAPLECIQLMKQCWSELPERRPTFNEIFDRFKTINKGKKTNIIDSMLRMLEQYSSNLEDLIRERTEELEVEKQKTEKLLSQMLPPSVAEALKTGGNVEPEYFDQVTIYFSDIVGFTTISALSEPIQVIDLLNDLYTLFDAVLGNHDVYKVETIGDAYMVASGLPKRNGNKHAAEIANMSLDILSSVGTFKMRHMPDVPIKIRIGMHSGPCVAGVVGLTMPRYCLFGDTINTASRMESTGLPYRIHVNQSTVRILRSLNEGYRIQVRGKTELKGKGIEETYWLVGKDDFTAPLPEPPAIKPGEDWQKTVTEEITMMFRKVNRKADKHRA
ncbi:retinal guanylyl cyclase 2 isoform X2 [Chiloscyllium plagiosum]|uniref:retinal guanylyl cyclase 2 isoform X2 n=1 Tax=Chiloscyllium plagiosum TaxID=36176 RepID=UPI001CB8630C|nr:retinal guanylyl cyclase 2 isoform X2 [Chiloscyllium plagiosum]